jgi:hypothetical protein
MALNCSPDDVVYMDKISLLGRPIKFLSKTWPTVCEGDFSTKVFFIYLAWRRGFCTTDGNNILHFFCKGQPYSFIKNLPSCRTDVILRLLFVF